MSRYLKADPGTVFKGKKVFTSTGGQTFTFPGTASTAKVMVFGGGGNACAAFSACPTCCCYCCPCYCVSCIFYHSGAGGGYAEKTYSTVGGVTACIVVGAVEGTSSFCISGAGTTSATGGTSASLGHACPARCTAVGVGSGGDINKCGSLGACQYSSFYCNCCYGGCQFAQGNIVLPGGAPGSTVLNGCAPVPTCNLITCFVHCLRQSNPSPYGTTTCNCYNCQWCVFCDLPKGFGACPVETDKYYAYDWDITGGASCTTAGNPTATSVTVVVAANCSCSCNTCVGCCLVQTITLPSTYTTGTSGGLAGSGSAGGNGGLGGGGGGIYTSCATPKALPGSFASGGGGLVVVYY